MRRHAASLEPGMHPTPDPTRAPSLPSELHALTRRRGEAKELLAKLLGDQVRVFTTKCVMRELRGLGAEYDGERVDSPAT